MKSLGNAGDFSIWIFSIVVSLAPPVFVMYWIIFEKKTFTSLLTDEITSAVAPAVIALIAGAFMAQVFSSVFRACIHSSIVCFLADHEMFVEIQGFADQDMNTYFKNRVKTLSDDSPTKQVANAENPEVNYSGVHQNEVDEHMNENLDKSMDLEDPKQVKAILEDDEKLTKVTQKIFDEVDVDKSGAITRNEMKTALQMLAKEMEIAEPTDKDVNKAMVDFDADGSGVLSVEEFKAVVVEILKAIVEG